MPLLLDLIVRTAAQHTDDMRHAEAVAGPLNGGENHIRFVDPVRCLNRINADVAIAAGFLRRLAKIAQQHTPSAVWRFAISD